LLRIPLCYAEISPRENETREDEKTTYRLDYGSTGIIFQLAGIILEFEILLYI
jgi:hypothetical protein